MNPLEVYFEELIKNVKVKLLDLDNLFEVDYSEFNYIDGEEGDYGKINFKLDGVLVATKVIEGGDSEYFEFTSEGNKILYKMCMEKLGE